MLRCRGFIFPLGVFTAATIRLGATLPSACLSYLSMFFVAALVVLWVCVSAGTVHGAVTGHLFQAPCLASRPSMDLLVDAAALEESAVSGRKLRSTHQQLRSGASAPTPPTTTTAA